MYPEAASGFARWLRPPEAGYQSRSEACLDLSVSGAVVVGNRWFPSDGSQRDRWSYRLATRGDYLHWRRLSSYGRLVGLLATNPNV